MPTTPPVTLAEPADRAARDGMATAVLWNWLCTDVPARFARRHAALAAAWLVIGLAPAVLMRLELLTPRLDLLEARTFGALLSLHASLLVYVVWLPAFPTVAGYLLVPRLLRVRTLAWPRLMPVAWGLLLAGGLVMFDGFARGGTEAGWTFDHQFGGRFSAPGTLPLALGVGLAGLALAIIGLNLVATMFNARHGRVATAHLPAVVALFGAAATAVVAGAEIVAASALVGVDHLVGLTLFDAAHGGDLLLFKRLCRLFLSAAQSLTVLTAFAVVLEGVAGRSWAALDARGMRATACVVALLAIAGLGGWPTTEPSVLAGPFSGWLFCGLFVAVGAATIGLVARTAFQLWRQGSALEAGSVFTGGFLLGMAVLVGSGAALAMPASGHLLGGTTFATAHFHVLALTLSMALLAGLHSASPPRAAWARVTASTGAVMLFIGTYLTFLPMFAIGVAGASFRANSYPPAFLIPEVLSTAGMTILLAGLGLSILGLSAGQIAGWRAPDDRRRAPRSTPASGGSRGGELR